VSFDKLVIAWTKRATLDWQQYTESIAEALAEPDPIVGVRLVKGAIPIATALAQPDKLAGEAGRLVPLVDRAVAASDVDRAPPLPASTIVLVDLANVLACVGGSVAEATTAAIVRWLPEIDIRRDEEIQSWYWNTGFAAVALDEPATYRRFAGVHDPGPLAFEPGATHGHNLQAVIRHLAAAIETKASFDAIEPAWREVLDDFEVQWSAGRVDAATLLWIARIVYHRIGGHPLGEVARRLHDEVWP